MSTAKKKAGLKRGRGKACLSWSTNLSEISPRGDYAALQHTIMERVRQQPWLNSGFVNITVKMVGIWGSVNSMEQHTALLVLVREVAGRAAVEDHVRVGALETLPGWV